MLYAKATKRRFGKRYTGNVAKNTYSFKAKVWLYPGAKAAWHFVNVPKPISGEIQKRFAKVKRGWGSLRVRVTVGQTKWDTSIFPDSKAGTYLLPIKASVRRSEGLFEGETADFSIEIKP